MGDLVGERLHVVGACPRVDLAADIGFLLDVDLRITGDTCREVGRQGDGLVQSVGVQRLGVSQGGAHGLDGGTCHVVERILLRKRPARGLRVGAQRQRLGVLGLELLDDLGPQHTCRAHLGDLHEVVHADCPEERQAGGEGVHRHACVDTCAQVLQSVGQRVGQLDVGRGACLLHVVPRDRDRVELGHVLRGVLEDVGNDAHRELGGINIGVTHHELLEDVVLDRTGQLVERATLLQTRHDVECQDGQHGAVHGHRHRHLVERNAVEQYLHVLDRADRHAGFAHVAHHARVVGVVAAVRSKVECHRQTLLPGGQVAAVECVGLLGGRETRILADRPRAHHVHRRVGAAQERGDTCRIVQVLHAFEVLGRIGALDGNTLGRQPRLDLSAAFRGAATFLLACVVCQF